MQKLREAQGAFAKDSGAFQRMRESGRLLSPSAYSPQADLNPMTEITQTEDGKVVPTPRAYTPRNYLEDAPTRRIDMEHLASPEVSAKVRNVSPQYTVQLEAETGTETYHLDETATPKPMDGLIGILVGPEHGYLRELYRHYSALSHAK